MTTGPGQEVGDIGSRIERYLSSYWLHLGGVATGAFALV